jgi:hypothetical protein
MKLTLLITTNNDTVVSQNIVTEWDIKKNQFVVLLLTFMSHGYKIIL